MADSNQDQLMPMRLELMVKEAVVCGPRGILLTRNYGKLCTPISSPYWSLAAFMSIWEGFPPPPPHVALATIPILYLSGQ
jgi:hypothetical protein